MPGDPSTKTNRSVYKVTPDVQTFFIEPDEKRPVRSGTAYRLMLVKPVVPDRFFNVMTVHRRTDDPPESTGDAGSVTFKTCRDRIISPGKGEMRIGQSPKPGISAFGKYLNFRHISINTSQASV